VTEPQPHRTASQPPRVELGDLLEGGLAPAIMAIVDRGVQRRPELASRLRAEVELNLAPAHPPVRIQFETDRVLVEDGPGAAPDLRVTGTLADLVGLMVAPQVRGVPSPIDRRGWSALGMLAGRRVRVEGRLTLMRQLLGVLRI
jgi:hypothetical protein